MPAPDRSLLASLERDGVPSVHNMILGDRVLSELPYEDALGYATFLARRMRELFLEIRPSIVIGAFDGLHGAMGLAVARSLGIQWLALNFSVIPPGYACFCDAMTPASRVPVAPPLKNLAEIAELALQRFEERSIQAPAYTTPPALSPLQALRKFPARVVTALRLFMAARDRAHMRYTEDATSYDLWSAFRHLQNVRLARSASAQVAALTEPPRRPFVMFGLHTQPESSIDVWAPFYSDQYWVVQAVARALPPTHTLLVKVHKSDAAKYSRDELLRFKAVFGVELVAPFADTRSFVDRADMIVSIQGTMGLEGALLGKPVLMLGDSPVTIFPSAERVGELSDLPSQVRRLLAQPRPTRTSIAEAFVQYLAPFQPAAHNDWTIEKTPAEIQYFAAMFAHLRESLSLAAIHEVATE